jgi:DNA-binding CsgD family transcriptional regulator
MRPVEPHHSDDSKPSVGAAVRLTEREAEIARRLAHGRTNKQIAAELGISPHTVRDHVSMLLMKTGTPSRVRLAAVLARAFLFGLDLLI